MQKPKPGAKMPAKITPRYSASTKPKPKATPKPKAKPVAKKTTGLSAESIKKQMDKLAKKNQLGKGIQ